MDRERQHDDQCIPVGKPIDQLPNRCAAAVRSECCISLELSPVRIEGPKRYKKTFALQDTGSDVTVVQRELLESVGLRTSSASLPLSTVKGTATWDCEMTDLTLTSLSGQECLHYETAFCVGTLPI